MLSRSREECASFEFGSEFKWLLCITKLQSALVICHARQQENQVEGSACIVLLEQFWI